MTRGKKTAQSFFSKFFLDKKRSSPKKLESVKVNIGFSVVRTDGLSGGRAGGRSVGLSVGRSVGVRSLDYQIFWDG